VSEEYRKPHLTLDQQAELLAGRGMQLDQAEAVRWLSMVGYYRLSGYWYPYRQRTAAGRADEFETGTSWTHVVALYDFDRRLRLLLLDALERIEIGMRARIGYNLGRRVRSRTWIPEISTPASPNQARPTTRARVVTCSGWPG
jgi:abortive infection bacteriophage resistance protein